MMKIGVIGAMPQEVQLLQESLIDKEEWTEAGIIFYSGRLGEHEVIVVQSGIGKVLAAMTSTLLISHYQVEVLINTGSAGGIGSGLNIGDLVISDKVAYHDVDVTAFGYSYGQMAGGMPLYYEAASDLIQIAQKVANTVDYHTHTGLIVSGDTFIHQISQVENIKQHFPEALANEMEATAIAQVATQYQIPFLIIRVMSDTADETASVDFNEFIAEAGKKSGAFVLELIEQI